MRKVLVMKKVFEGSDPWMSKKENTEHNYK